MPMGRRSATTAVAVALSLAFSGAVSVLGPATPVAAADGLRVESTTTYTIDATAGSGHSRFRRRRASHFGVGCPAVLGRSSTP